jgi:flavorubredoxin
VARIDEIAPDLFRVSIYLPQFDLQFNHFLIKDDEPLLFHTGMRRMFPEVRQAVARLIDPAALRWISWSHFEVDECGALNEWLAVAPRAQAICSQVGAAVNIEDFANRPPRGLSKDDVIETGRHTYRFVPTPHLPHGWDAGVLFEENRACSCAPTCSTSWAMSNRSRRLTCSADGMPRSPRIRRIQC